MTDNKIQINRKWTEIEISASDYARIVNHSEKFIQETVLRREPKKRIRIRISTGDLLDSIHDIKGVDMK